MATFTVKNDEGVQHVEKFLESNSYLSGGNAPGAPDRELLNEIEQAKFVPCHTKSPNLYGWWWTLVLFREPARALWGASGADAKKGGKKEETAKEAGKPAEKKEDAAKPAEDELDLFGDDPAAEEEAAKQAEKRKADAASKKKAKPVVIAKSEVIFNVKGYEVSDDFEALAKKIKSSIVKEGLVWKDEHKIVPIGFGMNMLELGMIIVDELISTDDIFEIIEGYEEVQSVDVLKFNKA